MPSLSVFGNAADAVELGAADGAGERPAIGGDCGATAGRIWVPAARWHRRWSRHIVSLGGEELGVRGRRTVSSYICADDIFDDNGHDSQASLHPRLQWPQLVHLFVCRRHRLDNFICGDNGGGVVGDIDCEGCVHLLIGVAGGRILDHRDFVAQFSAVPDSCL